MSLRTTCLLTLVLLATGAVRADSPAYAARNPFLGKDDYSVNHRYQSDPAKTLVLAKDGKPNVEIVVPQPKWHVVTFAATELKHILEASLGGEVPIVNERTGNRPAIVLGDSDWARAWGVDAGKLPRDAFVIRAGGFGVPPGVVLIVGRDDPFAEPERALTGGVWGHMYERATLFGVYEFAERFVGARFYFPGAGGTVIPSHRSLTMPAVDIYEAPDFPIRRVSWYAGQWPGFEEGRSPEKYRAQNLNWYRLRGSTRMVPSCHGLSRMAYIERFGKDHPEYFSLLPSGRRDNDRGMPHPGALCYSNKGFREELYRDAEAYLTGKSAEFRKVCHARWGGRAAWDPSGFQPGFFDAMPQDALGERKWCQCPDCLPYWKQGRPGELIWEYTAELARRLKKNNIPGYITNMAYSCYKDVPSVDLPDNVLVDLAERGPWEEDDPKARQRSQELIEGWNKKIAPRKIWLWNYMNNYGGAVPAGVPPVSTRAVSAYYKRVAPHVLGMYLQSDIDYALFNQVNIYLAMKLAWDTSTDVEALLSERNRVLFGPAARPMGEFFDRLEQLWMTRARPRTVYTEMGPVPVRKTEREVWDEIYTDEVMVELEAMVNRAEQAARDDADALKRVQWYRKHYFGFMQASRKAYAQGKRQVEDLVLEVARVPAEAEVKLDGKLDEPAWKAAAVAYLAPYNTDEPPQVKTAVRLLWTDKTLYVGIECEEPKAADLMMPERKRDDKSLWQDASVELFLNPSGDRRTYVQFIVGAGGAVADMKVTTDDQDVRKFDWSMNAGITCATSVGKDRWIVELAVPIADLTDKPPEPGATWVANIARSRNVRNLGKQINLYTWSPYLQRGFHDLERFGRILFVDKVTGDQGHVLENGSFEQLDGKGRPVGWHLDRKRDEIGSMAVVDDDYRDGRRSLRIGLTDPGRLVATQYFDNLEPGSTYLLTFFIRADKLTRHPGAREKFIGAFANVWSGRNFFFPRNRYLGTFGWTKEAFTFEAPANANEGKTYIRLGVANTTGTVHFDDVRIRKVN